MTQILVDAITNMTFHGGVLRVECATVTADSKHEVSGVLVIPGMAAGSVVQSLIKGMQELEKKIREQQPAQTPVAGNA